MKKKNSETEKKKLVSTVVKQVVKTNTVLPILENVLLQKDTLTVTDLENYVVMPFKAYGVVACLPAGLFLTAMDATIDPVFTAGKDRKVLISEGAKNIQVPGDNVNDYPKIPAEITEISTRFEETEMGYIKEALSFVSKDDLRPAMTGIYFSENIVATDAHRLMWKKLKNKIKTPFIMPPKTARILLALGGKWDVAIGDNGLCVWFYRNDGVKVYCGTIDDIFPDYKAVIPKPGKCVASVSVDKEELIREIKTAIKFSNKSTNKIELVLNGSLKIHSLDVDFDTEYTNELKGDIKYKDIDEKDKTFKIIKDMPENCYRDTVYIKEVISDSIVRISYPGSKESFVINRDCLEEIQMDKIAFNGNFIIDIAKRIDKNKPVEISLFGKTKAAIFNKSYLVMPLLTNN